MPKNGTSSLTNHSNLARRHGHHLALRFGKCPVPNHFHRQPVNLRHQPVPSGDRAYRDSHTLPILPSIVLCLVHSGTPALDVYIIRLFLAPFQPRTHARYHRVRVRCTAYGILTTMYLYLTVKAPYSLSRIIFGVCCIHQTSVGRPVNAIEPPLNHCGHRAA